MDIEWRGIILDGKYLGDYFEVSNTGEIRNIKNKEKGPRPVKQQKKQNGYMDCSLTIPGQGERRPKVHTIVAETFLGPKPFKNAQVNHKDGDKTNNHVSNLEWVSQSENMRHAEETGLMKSKKKAVVRIDKDGKEEYFPSVIAAAKALKTKNSTQTRKNISRTLCGITSSSCGYRWRYANNEDERKE